ncbi:MAG: phosphatase PAP2 family protein [Dehalococcoidia bacterium]
MPAFITDPHVFLPIGAALAVAVVITIAVWALETGRRAHFLSEVAVIAPAWLAYFLIRGATQADPAQAIARGRALADFERDLGIYIEQWLNDLITRSDIATSIANWIYIWGHWPLILGVAIWLFWHAPEAFSRYKHAFLLSGAIGLAVFFLFPTAPPRLAEPGLIDTVTARSDSYRVLQPPALTNQYAAMPSLHVGWNLLIGIALAHNIRGWAPRVIGWLSPFAMAFAAVSTANHFLVDIVAGASLALFALWTVKRWERLPEARRLELRRRLVPSPLRRGSASGVDHPRIAVGDDAVDAPRDELIEAPPVVDRPAEDRRGELA